MTTRLTLPDVQQVAFALARERLSLDEPIPDCETRFPGRLEACLEVPFQSFGGHSPYGSLVAKAGILFYLLIKDHPFQNGNKRIALTSLFVFLFLNGKWLKSGQQELYRLSVGVAESDPKMKDLIVAGVTSLIDRDLVPADARLASDS